MFGYRYREGNRVMTIKKRRIYKFTSFWISSLFCPFFVPFLPFSHIDINYLSEFIYRCIWLLQDCLNFWNLNVWIDIHVSFFCSHVAGCLTRIQNSKKNFVVLENWSKERVCSKRFYLYSLTTFEKLILISK